MEGTPVEVDGSNVREVTQAFKEFWYELAGIAGSPARGLDADAIEVTNPECSPPSYLQAFTDTSSEGDPEALWFCGIPYRPGDISNDIDVRLQFNEEIQAIDTMYGIRYEIVNAVIRIQYIKKEHVEDRGRIGQVIHGLHFDFNEMPESNHPVFHAQFEPNCISPRAPQQSYRVEPATRSTPSFPRVPSAPVDVAGAAYMILHDHTPNLLEDKHGWPSETHNAIQKLPQFPKHCFAPEPQNGTGMFADWWYLHATSDDEGVPRWDFLPRE